MAHPKMIGAIMVALFAIGLGTEARDTWMELLKIGDILSDKISENLSTEDRADAEVVFSFARKHISGLGKEFAKSGQELLRAWDAVLHHPDQCNEFSLAYVARIKECYPWSSSTVTTLTEATRKYASKCLTPDYITNKIESATRGSGSGCFSTNCFIKTKEVKFIDDQLIADYWSDNPWGRPSILIDGSKSVKAVAKAVLRDPKRNIKDIKDRHDVHAYLKEHLYKPCSNYERMLSTVMGDLTAASLSLKEVDYEKLISSLDKDTQKVLFRYDLCSDRGIKSGDIKITRKVMSHLQPHQRPILIEE